ncbi:MAG: glycosyltransferase family 39 protein [Candidatus Omnitrophica bacterium]|nr:glycosyltransferase family 39 protein [Candidatus Omnitrophota bacterium]
MKNMSYKFWIKNILIPCFIIFPILYFTLPIISPGTDNLRMVRHFDPDEASLVEYAGETYSNVLVPLKENAAYPQLYYYLAGLFLFPFTYLKGINYHVIVIVLRSFNVLFGLITGILIYFFISKSFKSIWVGILGSLLFITTPEYLWWLVNSRPHPLELLFIIMIIYFCLRMIDRYQTKFLVAATVFIGLATATKFGGLFMIPAVWVACLYGFSTFKTADLISYLKNKVRLINFIAIAAMILSVLIPLCSILLYLKLREKFYILGINNLRDLIFSRDFRLLLGIMSISFLFSLFWFIMNLFSRKFHNNVSQAEKFRHILIINKSFLTLFNIIVTTVLIFIVSTPHCIRYPLSTLKKMGFQFIKSSMSTALDPGLSKPIFDSGGFVWFKMLFDNNIFNYWAGALFLIYLITELSNFRNHWNNDRKYLIKRLILWFYALCLLSVLFVFLSHRPHHYLLPIALVMSILIGCGVVEIIKIAKNTALRYLLALLLGFLLISSFYVRYERIMYLYNVKLSREATVDTGVAIGKWLEDSYSKDTVIWKDSRDFYVPPKFENVYFVYHEEDISKYFSQINRLKPDLLIITSRADPDLTNFNKVEEAVSNKILKGFKQIKVFEYKGPLAIDNLEFGSYKNIYVYAKANKQ